MEKFGVLWRPFGRTRVAPGELSRSVTCCWGRGGAASPAETRLRALWRRALGLVQTNCAAPLAPRTEAVCAPASLRLRAPCAFPQRRYVPETSQQRSPLTSPHRGRSGRRSARDHVARMSLKRLNNVGGQLLNYISQKVQGTDAREAGSIKYKFQIEAITVLPLVMPYIKINTENLKKYIIFTLCGQWNMRVNDLS